jgi:thiol-disulfide isomerase/thioredoxin
MKLLVSFCFSFLTWTLAFGQVSGRLAHHANQEVKLLGYKGLETLELAKTTIDSLGNFSLKYNDEYKGMGYLDTEDKSQLFIVLNESSIIINGSHLKELDSIKIENSIENELFEEYSKEHNQREKALAGWKYLLPQYQQTPLLQKQKSKPEFIQEEIQRLEDEDERYLNTMDMSTYASWYLPVRKLIDDMPLSAQRYPERIPKHIKDFREFNLNDIRLYHSGILDDLIEGHFLLLENSGVLIDSMYTQMNITTDYIVENLKENEVLLNEVGGFIFNLMEKRSLFQASEYLALNLLNQKNCTLEGNLKRQLETYRAMKVGNTAPDIVFSLGERTNSNNSEKLSEMEQDYTLVIFGAAWCPQCAEEIPRLKNYYKNWKKKYNLEIVLISLDQNKEDFTSFTNNFPWVNYCDYKSWESEVVKDYYVFGTPSMFLLDKNRKILLRPISIEQIDTWVNYNLK